MPKVRGNQKTYIEGRTIQWLTERKKRTNYDIQNTTQKSKDRATQTSLKSGSELDQVLLKGKQFLHH